MSYAEIAASGPKQSAEEARAPPLPQVEPTESSTQSLVDVDSPHVSTVPSDYQSHSTKTDTQAIRQQHEMEDAAREKEAMRERAAKAKHEFHKKEEAAKQELHEDGEQVRAKVNDVKETVKKSATEASDKMREAGHRAQENADNPVVIANTVVLTAVGAGLAYGAYRKHIARELSWKIVGLWAGFVGLFAAGDYYISQYFFQRYPPKK